MTKDLFHIAIHLHTLFNGGIERVMVNLTRNFVERGLKVDLVLNQLGYHSSQWEFPPEVRIVDLKASKLLTRLPNLMHYLRLEQPTALLSANHYANEVALLAKYLSGVSTRVIVSEHTALSLEAAHSPLLSLRRWSPFAVRLLYNRADGIIAVSQGVAKDIAHLTGLAMERIQTVYNPLVTPEILEKAKKPLDHPWLASGELPVVMGVGRLEEQKDFSTLIRAFAQVRQVRPARLMILGQGSQWSLLNSLVSELGLENDVAMLGFVNNPYAYIARADVLALSSAWEGFGNILVESMVVGTPVVSTNCHSGPAEILDNGKYGELVSVGDSEAMAQAILSVLSGQVMSIDPAWLYQYTLENVAEKYLAILGIT